MLSVTQAEQIIRDTFPALPSITVDLKEAAGAILREPIVADRPFPPFHRVTMDGVAISSDAYHQGQTRYRIQGIQGAGQFPLALANTNSCIEIMTGAVLPKGCDCVVPVEELEISRGAAILSPGLTLAPMQNVHPEGSDRTTGDVIVKVGTRLRAPEMALAATVGMAEVQVAGRPSIAVISTGDELVEVDETPQPHQLRRSNAHALRSALEQAGFQDVTLYHAPDEPGAVKHLLAEVLRRHRMVLISGGVSKGRFDFVPEVLADLDVEKHFHGVRQRPGKPLWYGTHPDGHVVFGLPGNPVSALVCCTRYVLPALHHAMGFPAHPRHAVLSETVSCPKPLTLFFPIKILENAGSALQAKPVSFNTSGDLAALVDSDGFVQLNEEQTVFEAGSVQEYWSWG
jgi:molybdopterin molybdotransferase